MVTLLQLPTCIHQSIFCFRNNAHVLLLICPVKHSRCGHVQFACCVCLVCTPDRKFYSVLLPSLSSNVGGGRIYPGKEMSWYREAATQGARALPRGSAPRSPAALPAPPPSTAHHRPPAGGIKVGAVHPPPSHHTFDCLHILWAMYWHHARFALCAHNVHTHVQCVLVQTSGCVVALLIIGLA